MSLRFKIISLLIFILASLGLSYFWLFLKVIGPSFMELEERESLNDLHRVLNVIDREYDELNTLSHDWLIWEEIYSFLDLFPYEDMDRIFKENVFEVHKLNLLNYYDAKGELIWGGTFDLQRGEYFSMKEFSSDIFPPDHPLFVFDESSGSKTDVQGILLTEYGPMLIVAHPIFSSSENGGVIAAMIMGRFLNNENIKRLAKQVNVDFEIMTYSPDRYPRKIQKMFEESEPSKSFLLDRVDTKHLYIYSVIKDIAQESGVVIKVKVPRDIYGRSLTVMHYAIGTFVLTIIVIFIFSSFLLQKIIIGPLKRLTKHVLGVDSSGIFNSRIEYDSGDEIGILVKEFNVMTDKLAEANSMVHDEAFQQGVKELASGMMHNIRNSLLKLYSNTELIQENIASIPEKELMLARNEMATGTVSEDRISELSGFIAEANEKLMLFISDLRKRLGINIDVLKEIEKALRNYEKIAHREKKKERWGIGLVVREAVLLLRRKYSSYISIELDDYIDELGKVETNRVILIQVLINIFANAAESISRSGKSNGNIWVEVERGNEKSANNVHLRICDNGEGIDSDVLPRIFDRGFTTKLDRDNMGFGLHWCKNALEALNSKIYAESGGKGQGACFHIILPISVGE